MAIIDTTPDPGGVFASDAHRRIAANVPNPDDDAADLETLIVERVNRDHHLLAYLDNPDQLVEILKDLEADGHVTELKSGWKNTASGLEALQAEPVEVSGVEQVAAVVGLDPADITSGGS